MFSVLTKTLLMDVVVVFSMRLMGKRQIGELQPSELVSTFLISNLASVCIEDPDLPPAASIMPVLLICALEILNSFLCYRFKSYARFLSGKPVTVIREGVINQAALRDLRMSTGDLLEAMRGKDLFTPRDVFWGVVETDGSLSLCPENAPPAAPMLPLVVDGCVQHENLYALHKTDAWLTAQLSAAGTTLSGVALLLANERDRYLVKKSLYQKENRS